MTQTVQMPATAAGAPSARTGLVGRTLRDSGYAVSAFFLAVPAFVVVVVGSSLGLGLLVLGVGLAVLAVTLRVARWAARFERHRLRGLGRSAPEPRYAVSPPDSGVVRRVLVPLRDPQSWLDLVWGVVGFVTGTTAFAVTVAWWAAAAGGLSYWFWERFLPDDRGDLTFAEILGVGSGREAEIWVTTATGLAALLTLPLVVRLVVAVHAGTAAGLLSSRAHLQAELDRAQAGRVSAREAEASSLRRLERDIHDGPQQRLVRLSMDIARARRQLGSDPSGAEAILDGALLQARGTVDELRSLSRGIAPPVLVDRGLAAALDEVVGRCPVPAELETDVQAGLPAHVETTVYFVVSEALTNVAKHSGAGRVDVLVSDAEVPGHVVVLVGDDGRGGAALGKGHGLAGLEQRVRAVDGVLDVESPSGGPTLVRAEIPCG